MGTLWKLRHVFIRENTDELECKQCGATFLKGEQGMSTACLHVKTTHLNDPVFARPTERLKSNKRNESLPTRPSVIHFASKTDPDTFPSSSSGITQFSISNLLANPLESSLSAPPQSALSSSTILFPEPIRSPQLSEPLVGQSVGRQFSFQKVQVPTALPGEPLPPSNVEAVSLSFSSFPPSLALPSPVSISTLPTSTPVYETETPTAKTMKYPGLSNDDFRREQMEMIREAFLPRTRNVTLHSCNKCKTRGEVVDNRIKHRCPHEHCECEQCQVIDKERDKARSRMQIKRKRNNNLRVANELIRSVLLGQNQ